MLRLLIEFLERRVMFSSAAGGSTRFGVIGDYGDAGQAEEDVANLVKGWNPDYILTVGDNNYPTGEAATIDQNVGQYFHEYIFNYLGAYGPGSDRRRFLPALGDHDWDSSTGAQPYLDYFDLPGNERYYEFAAGPVHFFVINSDPRERDGVTSTTEQAQWLQAGLASATEPYKLVLMHHPAYSSSSAHGSTGYMQWPFAQWGATAVLAGHNHVYERLSVGGLPYFTNGVGGTTLDSFGAPIAGSELRFNSDFGAMQGEADNTRLRFKFYTRAGTLIDTYTTNAADPQPNKVTVEATDATGSESGDAIEYTFTRTGSTSGPLTVNFSLGGTAFNGFDYFAPTSITFADGADSATLTIRPADDAVLDPDRTIVLTLSMSDDYNTGAAVSGTATIVDNDALTTLLPLGSVWKYLDDGSDQGTAWTASGFNDSTWASGAAQLGYGDGDEVTVVNSGPTGNVFITTYFRARFEVANASQVGQLRLRLVRDDGALMHVNGIQIVNNNMPGGPVNYQTLAVNPATGPDESFVYEGYFLPVGLVTGTNVIAVEVHQVSATSDDMSFDAAVDVVVDAAAPVSPSTPDLAAAADSGISSTDNITNVLALAFTGTAESGSFVRIYANGSEIGAGFAFNGVWSINTIGLPDGQWQITATATDSVGNISTPSPALAITIDTTRPVLGSSAFLFDLNPMRLRFGFSESVQATLSLVDFLLQNLTTPSTVDPGLLALVYDEIANFADIRFPGIGGGILQDADYRATVQSSGISDVAGNTLVGNPILNFFFLNADATRDRVVSLADFDVLAANFGQTDQTFSHGDFNYDGLVNLRDFNRLATQFGKLLPPPAASRAPFGSARIQRDPWFDELLK